ncbi:MAG: hypothetical protein FJY10_04915 [Bacteroidetes bacterium]|nr:hypothetical protein [Bacteroidota bacterium]
MTTKEDIERIVSSYIEQSSSGLTVENSKFDFKREWYDLKKERDIQEFVKDTTSMVNTFGPDGIIVIGYDEKTKEFKDSTLPVDPSDIVNLINKRVDRLFEINTFDMRYQGHSLSIIHIPPSMDKPHIIRNYKTYHPNGKEKNSYQNISLVRKNSRTDFSTRYDLDLMLWDNKNVIPEYRILSSYNVESIHFVEHNETSYRCIIYLTLENTGGRPVGINHMKVKFKLFEDSSSDEEITFEVKFKHENIIIPTGNIWNKRVDMFSSLLKMDKIKLSWLIGELNKNRKYFFCSPLFLTLSTGISIESELKRTF